MSAYCTKYSVKEVGSPEPPVVTVIGIEEANDADRPGSWKTSHPEHTLPFGLLSHFRICTSMLIFDGPLRRLHFARSKKSRQEFHSHSWSSLVVSLQLPVTLTSSGRSSADVARKASRSNQGVFCRAIWFDWSSPSGTTGPVVRPGLHLQPHYQTAGSD